MPKVKRVTEEQVIDSDEVMYVEYDASDNKYYDSLSGMELDDEDINIIGKTLLSSFAKSSEEIIWAKDDEIGLAYEITKK